MTSVYQGQMVRVELLAGVATITLHGTTEFGSPSNELGQAMLAELETALDALDAAHAHAPLIITSGVAGVFSAGADLRGLYEAIVARQAAGFLVPEQKKELRTFLQRIHAFMTRVDLSPRMVVMHTHGVCFGGGFELALTGDVLVADRSTRFAFPELRLGLIPGFGGIPRLRRELHNGSIRDLLLTGRSLGAERAYQLGLVQHLASDGSGLAIATALAKQATRQDAQSIVRMKRFLKPSPDSELAHEIETFVEMAFTGDVLQNALRKFVQSKAALPYLP